MPTSRKLNLFALVEVLKLTVVYLYEIQVYKLNRNESSASSIWRRRYLILQNSYNWSYPSGQNSIKIAGSGSASKSNVLLLVRHPNSQK